MTLDMRAYQMGFELIPCPNVDYMNIENCGQCSFLRMCFGGCRGIAYMESGSLMSGLNTFACALKKRHINTVINRHAMKALDSNEE